VVCRGTPAARREQARIPASQPAFAHALRRELRL